ncbi:hypothetical protein Tco_0388668, partial [Tanacetum coccineum]
NGSNYEKVIRDWVERDAGLIMGLNMLLIMSPDIVDEIDTLFEIDDNEIMVGDYVRITEALFKNSELDEAEFSNSVSQKVEEVHDHLLRYGFLPGYTIWTIHGELATPPTSQSTSVHETSFVKDDMIGLVRDAFGLSSSPLNHENTEEEMPDGNKMNPPKQVITMIRAKVNNPVILAKPPDIEVMVINWVKVQTHASQKSQQKYPGDGLAWKAFNGRYPKSALDPRSVRLGLASDGCNPFRTMNTQHSTWPVLLIPYNLPPWICMKQQSFILSAIIQGEKGLGNDIDVYLQPLRQELNLLWKGVDAYDAFSKERFKLRASLLWTINDFPAYANLSGWSTKGRVACPHLREFNSLNVVKAWKEILLHGTS